MIILLRKYLLIALFFLLVLPPAYAQNKEKLKAEKEKIEQEIQYTNKLLSRTKKDKKSSLNQLLILNNKINRREELIATINTEINVLESRIQQNTGEIRRLRKELKNLKEEYAKMIHYAFRNRNIYSRLVYIFSAEDLNQAYRRLKYFQQYSSYRKTQAELIRQNQVGLEKRITELEQQKNEKTKLLSSKESEIEQLKAEKNEKNSTLQDLNKKEKELLAKLREKEEEANKLQNAIEAIIAEEMRAAAERARAESKESKMAMTSDEMALSSNFESNRGRLPWPSERGIISGTFGEHPHPVLKRVKIKNNGVNILTDEGGLARAVFEGTVISVRHITNTNIAVIIKHGEYFSVYSNLIRVFVKRGDQVGTKQEIGVIYTDSGDNKTELHFEIWKGKSLLNPSYWLTGKN